MHQEAYFFAIASIKSEKKFKVFHFATFACYKIYRKLLIMSVKGRTRLTACSTLRWPETTKGKGVEVQTEHMYQQGAKFTMILLSGTSETPLGTSDSHNSLVLWTSEKFAP